MGERVMNVDKALHCAVCGDQFLFTSGEQELFRLRGLDVEPERCPKCAHGVLAQPFGTAKR